MSAAEVEVLASPIATNISVEQLEKDFLKSYNASLESTIETGKKLVLLLDVDPDAKQKLIKKYRMPRKALDVLEKLGKGQIRPQFIDFPNMLRLGIEDQDKILSGDVEALVPNAEGKIDGKTTIKVNLFNAIPEMRDQVLAFDHIRNLDEQRQYLLLKDHKVEKIERMPYQIFETGKVCFTKDTMLNEEEIKHILTLLKKIKA